MENKMRCKSCQGTGHFFNGIYDDTAYCDTCEGSGIEITVELVREFLDQASRKFGMFDSKKALQETSGNFKRAEEMLLEKEQASKMFSLVTYRKEEMK